MGQVRFPDLKTHMLEHPWLQNTQVQCNAGFLGEFSVLDCEPYYFNHGDGTGREAPAPCPFFVDEVG